jgi:hypothetical protein
LPTATTLAGINVIVAFQVCLPPLFLSPGPIGFSNTLFEQLP